MDLELVESEIIFSSDHQEVRIDTFTPKGPDNKSKKPSNNKGKKKMMIQTLPIDIPCNIFQHELRRAALFDYEDDRDELVPPHVIVGQRIADKITFSVYTGIGRTLKGRDLSEVRNSILRLTGFLES